MSSLRIVRAIDFAFDRKGQELCDVYRLFGVIASAAIGDRDSTRLEAHIGNGGGDHVVGRRIDYGYAIRSGVRDIQLSARRRQRQAVRLDSDGDCGDQRGVVGGGTCDAQHRYRAIDRIGHIGTGAIRGERHAVRLFANGNLSQLGIAVLHVEEGDAVVVGVGDDQQ